MSFADDIKDASVLDLPWQDLENMNILIAGATGLIGSALVDVLMERNGNYQVFASGRNYARAQMRFSRYFDKPNFHFICHDITEPLNGDTDFQIIIDAASGASPHLYNLDPVGVMKSNFMGVDNLLSYGRTHKLRLFLYVSSGEIYGEGNGSEFTENDSGYVNCASVRACYPSSKRAAETLCLSYAHQYGIDVRIARPCHVYGPYFTENDNRVYAQFIRNILNGENIVLKSDGSQFRSWCYVVDCVAALIYLLLKGNCGEAYNVADESSNISIKALAEMVASIGKKSVIFEIPKSTEKLGYNVVTKSIFSTKKLNSLGWKISGNMKEKMERTIAETIRFSNNVNAC